MAICNRIDHGDGDGDEGHRSEFAFYGPMGFDIGAVIGNLLLAYFAQAGHETEPSASGRRYRRWILDQVDQVWTEFAAHFLGLWRDQHAGDLYPAACSPTRQAERRYAGCARRTTRRGCSPTASVSPPPR